MIKIIQIIPIEMWLNWILINWTSFTKKDVLIAVWKFLIVQYLYSRGLHLIVCIWETSHVHNAHINLKKYVITTITLQIDEENLSLFYQVPLFDAGLHLHFKDIDQWEKMWVESDSIRWFSL